ncbi:predicted protein [Candida tropicalis MYA-3404]|uniref:MARVEL domain-containing protein n=1 Tax=Candida tropicalis (strain ATCC MYA-3404 / T1) TaxID=294747 RepID=C5MJ08_CANTT|nr:predicted protein [Candida tropicalis MYA-3404]EER30267.1 predicted protein [Candida tropicalis MYA-3404]KAG4404222.1 hypothetical protein JTP64_001189 [Candida tropicalis]
MRSQDPNKPLKVFISICFRVSFLCWPGIAGIIIGSTEIFENYYQYGVMESSAAPYYFDVIFGSFVFGGTLLSLVLLPTCGNIIVPAAIIFVDISLFAGCISWIPFTIGRGFEVPMGLRLSISSTLISFFILVLDLVGIVIPIYKEYGIKGLFNRKKFYYGGMFVQPCVRETAIKRISEGWKEYSNNRVSIAKENIEITDDIHSGNQVLENHGV